MSNSPKLQIKDGKVYATTLDIADYFNREHHKVLRAISNLLPHLSKSFIHANFVGYKAKSRQGKEIDAYELTQSGFAMIALGFTGEKAIKFREAYITRFDEMEAELRAKQYHTAQNLQLELFPHFNNEIDRSRPAMTCRFAYEQSVRNGIPVPVPETIKEMVKRGDLDGYKTGGVYYVYDDSIANFLKTRKL